MWVINVLTLYVSLKFATKFVRILVKLKGCLDIIKFVEIRSKQSYGLKKKRIILKRLIVRLKQKERNNNNKLRKGIIVVRTFYYLTTILYITANCKLLANICNIFREISLLQ